LNIAYWLEDNFLNTPELKTRLEALSAPEHQNAIKGIKRGIEREALRINPNGSIAKTPHPQDAGHPLTNSHITTDFSESLLEFITPVSEDPQETLAQLQDLQKYTLSKMGDELLWPMSMPCFIENQDDIALAYFGESNIGKMKTLYREGLKNRYGSMMQAIAGVHFNISFPDSLWDSLQKIEQNSADKQAFISEKYLGLIRNFKRELWLISYLFGASPALCKSFLQGRKSDLPFETLGKGTLYLEHGTALRLGDLGYTNSAQSSLKVMYNNLDEYIAGLREAIGCHSELYGDLADYKAETPQQLNKNILQIENEFYSPIRPKRNAQSGETPTQALARAGIEYVEIRALDVNPFAQTGISLEQIHFLDVFLTYCLLNDSPALSCDDQKLTEANLRAVVNFGRKPSLELNRAGEPVALKTWAEDIFAALADVALYMDNANGKEVYQNAVAVWRACINDADKTLSGQFLSQLKQNQQDGGSYAIELANAYKESHHSQAFMTYTEAGLDADAVRSHQAQEQKVASDNLTFVAFLDDYFANA
jgi:glutamate--cysteine ligase